MTTQYDETTDLPREQHQAPDGIDRANPDIPVGSGIEYNGEVITEARIKFVGGMSPAALKNPPKEGETRAYVVLATGKKHHFGRVNDETTLVVDVEPYVIYDRNLGPFGDQIERGPDEKVETDPDADVEDPKGGLFDGEGQITGDLEGEGDPDGDES
ncbi:hypothetical protein [Gordonia soli]|uniref:Uncharacterized protein n=1 Tax=Gordonia soli NBRC 108243 TaxID=1223545 RepID=M0QR38_9ACTN|nr:hypothetical protein [Gordonia soli]GAC71073.1 hypothetical protein GS4_51_00110 [Gordonia soli NBRC 108243]